MNHLIDNVLRQLTFDPANPMLFSCGLFWVLFLVFLPVYAMLKHRRTQMMIFVLAFSLYFYYKSSGWFFILLVCTSLCDWLLSHAIARSTVPRTRRLLTALSITLSLSVLGYFKYANFIVWNWSAIVGSNFQPLDIILPVGISFYTFQSISYVVDVYKQRIAPTQSWLEYAFYLSFFPQLVAGPIVRADYFLPQLRDNRPATREMTYSGLWLVMVGIVKKAIIADYIAQYNDLIFSNPGGYGGLETLMGIAGYTMQIYCDFSGYSDMAIGIALILGFRLSENFRLPYQSKNITEFWRRWHISLSFWFRDYVYIPLGGNRKGKVRMYFNNFLTMLVAGLWHGSSWMFVIWGALHGFGLVVHKFFSRQLGISIPRTLAGNSLSWLITYLYICFAWSFFRAKDLGVLGKMYDKVANDFSIDYLVPFFHARPAWTLCIIGVMLSYLFTERQYHRLQARFILLPWVAKLLLFIICLQMVVEVSQESVQPFIYYQF